MKRREKSKEIKRRKTRHVILIKKCWMCKYFKRKLCSQTGRETSGDAKGCDDLITTATFYCTVRHCYMSTEACVAIRQKKRTNNGNDWMSPEQYRKIYSECYEKCSQGRAMEWSVQNFGLSEKIIPSEPVKFKRRHKLKRREGK